MKLKPMRLRAANAFIDTYHRHHQAVAGCNFCLSVVDGDEVLGVAIVGRPLARALDTGTIAEVTRLCVKPDVKHACSMLYAASARACKAIGYERIITYILESESGVSLIAAGWAFEENTIGRSWTTPARPRANKTNTENKKRWGKVLI